MQVSSKDRISFFIIFLMSTIMTLIVFSLEPLAQSSAYHDFADQDSCCDIPHIYNVISNLPFLFVGIWGLVNLKRENCKIIASHKLTYSIFFFGVTLVGFGSAYYHLNPNNETLIWDRLPMTIAFMALFTFIIAEFISGIFAKKTRFVFLALGLLSVLYWAWSESVGMGDLRAYVLVQFLPLVLIPFILLRFSSAFSHVSSYWFLLSAYVIAKIFETFDKSIYEFLGFISGHSLKHLVAALGIWIFLEGLRKRHSI